MRPLCAIAILCGFTACGLNLTGTGGGLLDGGARDDAGATDAAGASDARVESDADADAEAGADATSDAGRDVDAAPACEGKWCGTMCVNDCNECWGMGAACGDTCVSSCEECDGRSDVCHTCTWPFVHTQCASLDGRDACPEADSACWCSSKTDCHGDQEVCAFRSGLYCLTCGEQASEGQGCMNGGTCRRTDAGTFACQ